MFGRLSQTRIGLLILGAALSGVAHGQDGFNLAPGERLLAVDGVAVAGNANQGQVAQASFATGAGCQGPGCAGSVTRPVQMANPVYSASAVAGAGCVGGGCGGSSAIVSGTTQAMATRQHGGNTVVIGEGTAAFQHALREAQIIAARGGNYHRHGDGGHPLGTAPGCRYSGTGYTWDMNRPGHCYENELPANRIVARARAQGANGAWFWSAHYR